MDNVDVKLKWCDENGNRYRFSTTLIDANFTVAADAMTNGTNGSFNLSGVMLYREPSLWIKLKHWFEDLISEWKEWRASNEHD